MLASIAVAATGQAMSPRRYSFESQVSVPPRSFPPPRVSQNRVGTDGGREGGAVQGRPTLESLKFFLGSLLPGMKLHRCPLFSLCLCWSHEPSSTPFSKLILASFGLTTGGDMAVLSEVQPRHFPETRNPDPGHGPRNRGIGAGAGGHRVLSSSHPRPATR